MYIDVMQGCEVSEFYYYIVEFDHNTTPFLVLFLTLTKKAGWFPNPPYLSFSD